MTLSIRDKAGKNHSMIREFAILFDDVFIAWITDKSEAP